MSPRRGITDAFVTCRTFGHSWFSIEAERNPRVGWYMKLRCERCGTERNDIVDRNGTVERRSYKHPAGYRLAKADNLTRSEWRVAFLARMPTRRRRAS